jgi:heat-inducible transcriptional repressor
MELQPQDLSERERQILHAVVHSYITTAEPVGSRTIVKRFGLDISPATVRNVMADLEEAGYLQQIHTSSGRVPTDKGYRYYVDCLMQVQVLTVQERYQIEREYTERLSDTDQVLRQTSHLLALITHHTGIVEAPAEAIARVRRIELMPVGGTRVAVLLVDNYGRVRSLVVDVTQEFQHEELLRLNQFLNEQLQDAPIGRLAESIQERLSAYLEKQRTLAEQALRVLQLIPANRPVQLFLDGTTQLFEQPEFNDVSKAREVLGLLEKQDRLIELMHAATSKDGSLRSTVVIGGETLDPSLEGISLVASPYDVGGRPVGMIGVLGPRRMPYPRLTAIVDYTAGMVGRLLTRLSA